MSSWLDNDILLIRGTTLIKAVVSKVMPQAQSEIAIYFGSVATDPVNQVSPVVSKPRLIKNVDAA